MRGVTLDTGALLAADRGDRRVWALVGEWSTRGVEVVVPAGCIAQSWRDGTRQALLSRLLRGCAVDDLDGPAAREVGLLLAASATSDVVDAHVVTGALRRGDAVMTSDPGDITALADADGRRLVLHRVLAGGSRPVGGRWPSG